METKEEHFSRDELISLARFSDVRKDELQQLHQQHVYIHKNEYLNILKWLLLAGGLIFISVGLIFFFAYNWKDMNVVLKFSSIWIFIIGFLIPAYLPYTSRLTKQLLITMCSVFVGILFAVYGQVYQTGAFTYQYIALWVSLISIWVFTIHFSPLWLIFHMLIIAGMNDYAQDWNYVSFYLYTALALSLGWNEFKPHKSFPYWYLVILMTAAVSISTYVMGISIGITFLKSFSWTNFVILLLFEFALLGFALYKRWIIPIAHLCFSSIILMNVKIINVFNENLFIPATLTLLGLGASVFLLVYLRNKWKNEHAQSN